MRQIYIIPDYDNFQESLALAKEYDCAFEFNDFFAPSILDDIKKQNEIIENYAKYRTDFSKDTMHGAFFDITVHSSDPLIRDASRLRVHQSMEIAKRMELRGVVFHTGLLAGFCNPEYLNQWKTMNSEFFRSIAVEYPNIQIFMENMFDRTPNMLADFAKSMSDVKNFGVCLDYAHASLVSSTGEKWIKTLAPYIKHMHINDNDLIDDLHSPIGSGKINWQMFEQFIKKYEVKSSVLIEVKGIERQRKSLEYMKKI